MTDDVIAEAVLPRWVRLARLFGTATLHEAAGGIGALPSAIRPMTPHAFFAGAAFTVVSPSGDNLWIHRAVNVAPPGSVLLVSLVGDREGGHWGEVLSHAAFARGIVGCVIDGQVRDVGAMGGVGLPIFARGVCIRGTGKDPASVGGIGVPLRFADVEVSPGDFVVGDADGVVSLPFDRVADVLESAAERFRHEQDVIADLYRGRTTMEIYGLREMDGVPVQD